MKLFVGYTVFNKVDMLIWLLDGIIQHFDPAKTEVGFFFDASEDGSLEHFECVRKCWLEDRGFRVTCMNSPEEVRELGGHNKLLKHFMESTDCEMMIAPQDDQKFQQPFLPHLERICAHYGERLGVIGGRDGYLINFTQMAGSKWSASNVHQWLDHGQIVEKPMINSGPVIYHRSLVDRIGYLDEKFHAFYVWDDYGQRALKAGLTNLVMGTDMEHAKFGRAKQTSFYVDTSISARDIALLHAKHGPVL